MKLLVFGDSIAFGACATQMQFKWGHVLARHLRDFQNCDLVLENKGLPGDTLTGADQRLETDVIAQQPDLLVAALGLNDLRMGRSIDSILSDYKNLLVRVRNETPACGICVVSVFPIREEAWRNGPPHDQGSSERRLAFNKSLNTLAADMNLIYANAEPPAESINRLIHPDGVHPNNLGHRFIGNAVANALLTAPQTASWWTYDHDYQSVGNYGKQTTRYA